jgi:hypothetical protein
MTGRIEGAPEGCAHVGVEDEVLHGASSITFIAGETSLGFAAIACCRRSP